MVIELSANMYEEKLWNMILKFQWDLGDLSYGKMYYASGFITSCSTYVCELLY